MNRITVSKIKNDINTNAEMTSTRVDAIFKSLEDEIKRVADYSGQIDNKKADHTWINSIMAKIGQLELEMKTKDTMVSGFKITPGHCMSCKQPLSDNLTTF